MLARLQKLIALSLIASALAWAAYFIAAGHPLCAWVGVLLILFGYALFLGAEFLALYLVQQPGPVPRANLGQLFQSWCQEVLTAPQVFLWRQLFRSNAEPDYLPDMALGQPGVVLVHGFVCNRGLWNPWMRELRARKLSFVAVNLEPMFGSIDRYPRIIEEAVARVEAATGVPVVLVGHSMGGLAI